MKYKVLIAYPTDKEFIDKFWAMDSWCHNNIGRFDTDWRRDFIIPDKQFVEKQYYCFLTEESMVKFSLAWSENIV